MATQAYKKWDIEQNKQLMRYKIFQNIYIYMYLTMLTI